MIRIVKWWENFENSGSRKLKACNYFSAPSGTDSKGYRNLMRKGADGVIALGVFQGLCQVLASLSQDARKAGEMRNSDGSLMDKDDLLDLTRLPDNVLTSAINLLVSVRWLEYVEPKADEEFVTDLPPSPDDLPLPANNLPPISQGTPDVEEGIVEEGIVEEEPKGSCPPADDDDIPIQEKSTWEIIWKTSPTKSRERSSKRQVEAEWKRIRVSDRPDSETLIRAIEGWKSSDDWQKDGGQFIPGLHRWIKARKWENIPEAAPDQVISPSTRKTGEVQIGGRKGIIHDASQFELAEQNHES